MVKLIDVAALKSANHAVYCQQLLRHNIHTPADLLAANVVGFAADLNIPLDVSVTMSSHVTSC